MTGPETDYLGWVMFNDSVIATDMLKVSPLGSGFMFGEGVFETMRVQNSRAMLFDAHDARLASSLNYLGAVPAIARGALHARCAKVIAANSLVNGSLKIVVFKETTGWSEMILARATTYAAVHYEAGFRLKTTFCDQRVDPLHALKSLNYLSNIRAKRIALAAGFDEAVFFNPQRQVLEGATTNIFMVKDGAISTPRWQSGILPGVMRDCVMQMPNPSPIIERDVPLDELLRADEVFVTNTLLGIMPVARVDTTAYNLGNNSITRLLMAALVNRLGAA